MARPRRGKPATAFGAWLDQWLRDHPDVTFEALGEQIGVTKSAISLWLTATHQAKIPIPRLRRIAAATGSSVESLEQLVYGATERGTPVTAPPEWAEHMQGQIEGLRAILERSPYAEQRRLAAEISAIYQAQDPATTSRRRAYWLQMARRNTLKLTDRALAKKAGVSVDEVRAWERAGTDIAPDLYARLADAYELPVSVIADPPDTDVEIARAFRARWLAEQDRVPLGEVLDRPGVRRRAS